MEKKTTSDIKDIKFRQSNNFIESRFSDFTLLELKTIEYLASQTKKADIKYIDKKENKIVNVKLTELAKLLNLNVEYMYQETDHMVKNLFVKYAQFKYINDKGKVEYQLRHFIEKVDYSDGVFIFVVNHEVLPYFVDIKKEYTDINLKYINALNSTYAIKMYKLLKQYKTIKTRVFTLEELKSQLGIVDTYRKYSNFKQKVLDVFINKINENTDINVEYYEMKVGKSVDSIEFEIK